MYTTSIAFSRKRFGVHSNLLVYLTPLSLSQFMNEIQNRSASIIFSFNLNFAIVKHLTWQITSGKNCSHHEAFEILHIRYLPRYNLRSIIGQMMTKMKGLMLGNF